MLPDYFRMFRSAVRVFAVMLMGTAVLTTGASAQTLIGNPFITGFEGWQDTYVPQPTQVGGLPTWGVLLTPDPFSGQRFLMETSDGREADDNVTADSGQYKPYILINSVDTTPANYTITAQLATTDNDGFGLVFGYQDNNNYFRVGFREQDPSNLGFARGTSVQKVVGGVISQIAGPSLNFIPSSAGTPFEAKVIVTGANWDIQVAPTVGGTFSSIVSGSDANLQPGKYGVHSWAQHEVATTVPNYGTIVGPISIASATLNKTTNFANAVSSIPWRRLLMANSFGEILGSGPNDVAEDHGNFAQDFINGVIRDDSNGNVNATAGAPNTDFLGPAIVVDSPGSAAMTNYRFTTRVENRDNDGIGLMFRVADDNTFYRINWSTEGAGTGTTRPLAGMSIQKYQNFTWTQVFSETTPKFLPADSVPFDVIISAVGNTFKVDVLEDPDGAARTISYDPVVDSTDPILAGSVGFTNWGNGEGNNGAVYSAFGGNSDRLVTAISAFTDIDLTINRTTNNVTLTNNTGAPVTIEGLSILSGNSAMNSSLWSSISANYDEPPGNGSVDPDDPWTVITSTDSELTEREQSVGGNGATLSVGETVNFGNIWRKSQIEDLALIVELTDGNVIFGDDITYTGGPGGMPFSRSDLNTDGLVNASDWPLYFPNMLADLSALTGIQRALAGDLDLDGDNDVDDFVLFKADFDAANGAGAFNAMLANVPEPGTAFLVFLAALVACASRSRRRSKAMALGLGIAALVQVGGTARAVPLDFTTFTQESYPATTFAAPTWDITSTTASVTNNGDASVLYSPTNLINKRITGTLDPGNDGDDDIVGFVLGFEPGDSAIGSSADYLLIDWKGANQNFNFADATGSTVPFHTPTAGATMPVGLAISRVTGSANADELWQHANLAASPTGGVQQLARGTTLGSAPYDRSGGTHQFEIIYTNNVVNVKVDGVEQFHIIGDLPVGRFGLYSGWQDDPVFSNFEVFDDISVPFLGATVDRSNGSITLENPTSVPVDFDFYQFSSASSSLDEDSWNSLSEQNFQPSGPGAHQKWQEAGGSDSAEIAEVYLDGNSSLAANTSHSIGAAYNNLINGEDLVFQYRLVTGERRNGFVNYIGTPPGLAGDFNDDGKVDAADYVVWRKTNGTQDGYNAWRMNFGINTGSGASLAGAASVPEPASVGIALCLAIIGFGRCKRWRGACRG